jgi:hypothetical protein
MYAFSGPHARKEDADNYSHSIPADYLGYFKENNVTDVVRLSQACRLRCATVMPGNRCLRVYILSIAGVVRAPRLHRTWPHLA